MDYRKEEIDAKIAQMDIAIEAFLRMAEEPLFVGTGVRLAAEKIRELRASAAEVRK